MQQTGRFSASRSGAASPISSEFGRLITSGAGSSASHSSSLSNSLRKTPRSPFEHRHRQVAEHLRIGRDRSAREAPITARRVPQPIEETRRLPEERHVLLQVDADAAEQHAVPADVGLVRVVGV